MTSSRRRTVITGLGIVCPIGQSREAVNDSLSARRSGVRRMAHFNVSALPCQIAGTIPDFDARLYVDRLARKSLKVMSRSIQLAIAGAQLALDDSGIDKAKLDPARF